MYFFILGKLGYGEVFSSFDEQANRGFARLQLCTNEDGNTNNLVLYTVRSDTSKKEGNAPRATD